MKISKLNGVKYYKFIRQSLFKKGVNLRLFSFPPTHSTELLCLLKCLFALFPDTSQKPILYTHKIYWFIGKWKNFISSVSGDSINIYWVKKSSFLGMSASVGHLRINFSDARCRPCSKLYVPDKCCSAFVNVIGAISRSLQKVQSFKNELSCSLWTSLLKRNITELSRMTFISHQFPVHVTASHSRELFLIYNHYRF